MGPGPPGASALGMSTGSQLSDSITLACRQGLEDFTLPIGPGLSGADWATTPQERREEEKQERRPHRCRRLSSAGWRHCPSDVHSHRQFPGNLCPLSGQILNATSPGKPARLHSCQECYSSLQCPCPSFVPLQAFPAGLTCPSLLAAFRLAD